MPRPREFDPSQALAAATELFTQRGFEGTTLALLTEATGVAKQSLYSSFGDKRSLLSHCLAQASQQFKPAQALLQPRLPGKQAIAIFFAGVLEQCADPANAGCLVSNLLLEKGLSDSEVRAEAGHYLQRTQELLEQTCARGLQDGSILSALSAKQLASLLLTWLSGMRVIARSPQPNTLKSSTEEFLQAILN
jgi:TetR/AcrR family transcriptional regulator, transcriptional repressor for nem operon